MVAKWYSKTGKSLTRSEAETFALDNGYLFLERSTYQGGMSVKVVATGVFDIIHIGHAHFLNAAKKHGDSLTVIVANDATVRKMSLFYQTRDELKWYHNSSQLMML